MNTWVVNMRAARGAADLVLLAGAALAAVLTAVWPRGRGGGR